MIFIFPHRTIDKEKAEEIAGKASYLTVLYDMIITSGAKSMPLDCVVISGNTVCGFTENSLVNPEETANYMKKILVINKFDKVPVKIFHDYKAFLIRVEGMNNIAAVEKGVPGLQEKKITQLILSISL